MVRDIPRISFLVLLLAFIVAAAPPARADLLGGTFEISGPNCRFPDVAYGSAQEKHLVVWADYNVTRVFGRWVTADGVADGAPFEISEAPYGALFPAVAYNATQDEFLVTWDNFNGRVPWCPTLNI